MNIEFTNSKGGVAKTTSASIVAQLLATAGYHILLVDSDPQMNLSETFLSKDDMIDASELYTRRMSKEEALTFVRKSYFEGIEVIPACRNLKTVVYTLYDLQKNNRDSILILNDNIAMIAEDYDHVIIDTSPFDSYLTDVALCAADVVFTPVEADNFSYEGVRDIMNKIERWNDQYELETRFGGMFIVKADYRTTRFKQLQEGYTNVLGDSFIPVYIRKCEPIAQTSTNFMPLLKWDRRCTGVSDYIDFMAYTDLIDDAAYQKIMDYINDPPKKKITIPVGRKEA
jgi:chromosome partitioning protein